jgi:methionyl-tRNA formyltransferase
MKNVTILCTDPAHPVNPCLVSWAARHAAQATTSIYRDVSDVPGGDILFLVSCHQIVRNAHRNRYRHTLVLHASALPHGRGMSPHVWQILQGASSLTVTLLNAVDEVDCGDIWHQVDVVLDGTELHDEIGAKLFAAELELMDWALEHCDRTSPQPQAGESSFFRRRTPEDSRIDPSRPLVESFDLLRVADPDRYPAFFEHRGQRYRIRLEKMDPTT